jgi:hypothetical protein
VSAAFVAPLREVARGQPIVDFGVVLRADAVEVDLGVWPNLQRVVAEAWQKLAAAWTGSRTLGGRPHGPHALGEHSPTSAVSSVPAAFTVWRSVDVRLCVQNPESLS